MVDETRPSDGPSGIERVRPTESTTPSLSASGMGAFSVLAQEKPSAGLPIPGQTTSRTEHSQNAPGLIQSSSMPGIPSYDQGSTCLGSPQTIPDVAKNQERSSFQATTRPIER